MVANKCEMSDTEKDIKRLKEEVSKDIKKAEGSDREGLLYPKVFEISAVTGMGVKELNIAVASKVAEIKIAKLESEKEAENFDKV